MNQQLHDLDPSAADKKSPRKDKPSCFRVCYICGRDFGSRSIDLHQTKCAKLWQQREAVKPRGERRQLPKRPVEIDALNISTHARNEAARKVWKEDTLEPCLVCGRTFLPDRLKVHEKSCNPTRALESKANVVSKTLSRNGSAKNSSNSSSKSAPNFRVCYICGKQFGSNSIAIHEPRCKKLWEQREAKKWPEDRRALPQRVDTTNMSVQQANEATEQQWNKDVLEPCTHCGRTFLPDRLQVHLRSCAPKSKATKSGFCNDKHNAELDSSSFSDKKSNSSSGFHM